jgi:mono/diheme cytochrome c family protein
VQKSIFSVVLVMPTVLSAILASFPACSAEDVDFAHAIVPILKTHCSKCHAGQQKEGGLSINTREDLIVGGDSGSPVEIGSHLSSEFFRRINSQEDGYRMPPDGDGLTQEQIALIGKWIDQGAKWESGYTFAPRTYEPPLKPRRPELPPVQSNRNHPIDRILDFELSSQGQSVPSMVSDEVFLRRVSLDLIGLLPTPEQRTEFLNDSRPDKRTQLVDRLLSQNIAYADHWLTFWNDLLRNDYTGTGFITGGRTQITTWLYDALLRNKPYDKMARELIAPPTPDSAGFINGIKWRGEVSAGQTVEIQFSQSVGQSFLGINLKCASCHDSFVDRWTLSEAFGLAAIYSERPLEIHRCDKPIGQTAEPKWLFPELGTVDPALNKSQRLEQLANLLTHAENGRFTRTIVNRLWHRLMGRGIVHPTDSMQTEPWNEDLLDYLAVHLADNQYDLKQTLRLIVTSAAYQSQSESVTESTDATGYVYRGPRAKKLTAEQFLDAIWQLTGAAPQAMDAQVQRTEPGQEVTKSNPAAAQWIWNKSDATRAPAGQTIAFRKVWNLAHAPKRAVAVVSCDNEYRTYLDGRLIGEGKQWDSPNLFTLDDLMAGEHELIIVGRNGGDSPNPAGLWCEVRYLSPDQTEGGFGTDASWQWSTQLPNETGVYQQPPSDWQAAAVVNHGGIWSGRVTPQAEGLLAKGINGNVNMIRASLVKSDFLMRSLGRPNRDQIVSVRPTEMTTIEAIDLSIGETLDSYLKRGAERLARKSWDSPAELVRWVYHHALGREPSAKELKVLGSDLSTPLEPSAVADILWAVIMLPEFQINR